MRAYLAFCVLAVVPAMGGCFGNGAGGGGSFGGSDPTCTPVPTVQIDTGATITHDAGINPGYYAEYVGSGAWHFEWTCDTKLSEEGCDFEGAITVPTPAGGIAATCFQCEADDDMTTQPSGANTEIDFDTITTTGIDGVDFVTTPGAAVTIDLRVNNLYQDDLVFIPSAGNAVTPTCLPIELQPSTP